MTKLICSRCKKTVPMLINAPNSHFGYDPKAAICDKCFWSVFDIRSDINPKKKVVNYKPTKNA